MSDKNTIVTFRDIAEIWRELIKDCKSVWELIISGIKWFVAMYMDKHFSMDKTLDEINADTH